MVEGDKDDWFGVFSAVYSGRPSDNGQKGKYRTPHLSIRGKTTPTKMPTFLLRGWPNTVTTCPEWFPEEAFPQLNLINNSTGVLYLRATTSPFLKEHCLLPSKLQWQSAALTQSSQEQICWRIKYIVKSWLSKLLGGLPLTTRETRIYSLVSLIKVEI